MPLLHEPRPEQSQAIQTAKEILANRLRAALVAPTGSGKSLIEAGLLDAGYLVTVPGMDIADGIARSARIATDGSEAKRRARYEAAGIWTYKRLFAALAAGTLAAPTGLVIDEGHHATSDTLQQILAMCPGVGVVLVTATIYRGTPQDTEELLKLVGGNVFHVLTLHAAVTQRRISIPSFEVVPLVNDDVIAVTGGEFQVRGCEDAVRSAQDALIALTIRRWWDADGKRWRRPGTIVLPSVQSVTEFQAAYDALGIPAVSVTAETGNRQALFARVIAGQAVLLQVRAVGEGTDLPLRWMVDAGPTMSPTLWMQRVGRICRPAPDAEDAPEYVTACHNLMRHAYLWEGLIPRGQVRQARLAWGEDFQPSRRTMSRALGLTGFGRFDPSEIWLKDGSSGYLYALTNKDGSRDVAALLLPDQPQPLYFQRVNRFTGETKTFEPKPGVTVSYRERLYGTWERIETLPELDSCSSFKPTPLRPKQLDWWASAASDRGLRPDWIPTAKEFTVLPILSNTRMRLT